ncbi:MAG: hypothetical protein WCY84_06460 [Candidatus Cloacimonadaceae bacterium]
MKYFRILILVSFCLLSLSCQRHNPLAPALPEENTIIFNEEQIPTAGEDFIYRQAFEIQGETAPEALYAYRLSSLHDMPDIACDEEGWLVFPNGSIWNGQKQLSFDFPSQNGKIMNCITGVQLKIKSPSGSIKTLSSPFKSRLFLRTHLIHNFAEGATVPLGLEITLRENLEDIFADGMYASHFMYRLNTIDQDLNLLQQGEWYSSVDLPDIRRITLNSHQLPQLLANEPNTYTQFQAYVVSRNGMEQSEPSSVYFKAVAGNKPVALIYRETLLGLGQYHYSLKEYEHPENNGIPQQGDRYNACLNLWEDQYHAINSPDFKLHLRWGYNGQYGILSSWGTVIYTNNPYDDEVGIALNAQSQPYPSPIEAFWLQINGMPFPYQPQFVSSSIASPPESGTGMWLRVKNVNDHSRHAILSHLPSGTHTFRLMVEDLQGELSEIKEKTFNLHPYITPEMRNGTLILDDSNFTFATNDRVDQFYDSMVPVNMRPVQQIDFKGTSLDISPPAAFLQDFKCVILHADNPAFQVRLHTLADALEIYLGNGGNLIFSTTSTLNNVLPNVEQDYPGFLANRLGLADLNLVSALSPSYNVRPYFIQAQAMGDLPDLPLELTNPILLPVASLQGLGPVALFSPMLNLDWQYQFGCKSVEHPVHPPSQAEYDFYSSQYVAYRYQISGGNTYVFGFPLGSMQESAVQQAMQIIFNDIQGGKITAGRK